MQSQPLLLFGEQSQGGPAVLQEALTFLGSSGTKSLSVPQRFCAAQDKVDTSIWESASVTPENHSINCWGSRCRGSHLSFE